jgi:hypothetical protein
VTRVRRKRVSEEVFAKIVDAMTDMATDEHAPRTKREIERRSGLAHDTIARAFRQDAEEDNQWSINHVFAELTGANNARRSPARQRQVDADQKVADLRQRLSETDATLQRYAMALLAFHLNAAAPDAQTDSDAVPIGRNRHRDGRR